MMINKHETLYGDVVFDKIPAHYADERIEVLSSRIDELLKVHWLERDSKLLNQLLKAKEWWQEFKELYCEETQTA